MPEQFQHIIPAPPKAADFFATYQIAFEFRRETEYRQELKDYYSWYHTLAQEHQRELEQMRHETNFFRWFIRNR